jgi:hypothetical protein
LICDNYSTHSINRDEIDASIDLFRTLTDTIQWWSRARGEGT